MGNNQNSSQQSLERAILPNLIGGLGNQLFIASAAYAMSKLHECPVYLCNETDNAHNTLNHDYRKTILKEFGIPIYTTIDDLRRANKLNNFKVYFHPDFQNWNPLEVQPPVILRGYYQNTELIQLYETELREMIFKGLQEHRLQLQDACKQSLNFDTTIFLHVRRGDYLQKSDFHFIQPITYYEKAYQYCKESLQTPIETVLLFSDDPDWVSQQPFFKSLPGAIVVNEPNELASLALMSLCKRGAICANSTFSWWGAFLGPHSVQAPICVPAKWINAHVENLFFPTWKVIE